ncbi:RIN4, pathogenic type III effector avirulence factor Avr cleavage site [Artemisia annua]|uniref:RIN4, pathogenic type III effector avirulence factor Avr cleavage site n=1 Tax=Artemisia annua TaxID=35608 RepID=A0A2U1MBU6_ARTAN|nr:RIN4, pathogenic type III effector avirulence factor Avr cleavage site [Artemisia annua]
MTSKPPHQPLPKFGEWDVKDPSSADGFTVIFAKARDEKKSTGTAAGGPQKNNKGPPPPQPQKETEPSKSRFCCF